MTDIPADVLAALQEPSPASPRIGDLRLAVAALRDLQDLKEYHAGQLKETEAEILKMSRETLPDLLAEAGVSSITLEATGNHPAFLAEADDFYHANIAAEWDEAKRKIAFDYLDEAGSGDMIKTMVIVSFPRDAREKTLAFLKFLSSAYPAIPYVVQQNVPWNTLTAWVREQVGKGKIPELDKIGGFIGRVVKLKEIK